MFGCGAFKRDWEKDVLSSNFSYRYVFKMSSKIFKTHPDATVKAVLKKYSKVLH